MDQLDPTPSASDSEAEIEGTAEGGMLIHVPPPSLEELLTRRLPTTTTSGRPMSLREIQRWHKGHQHDIAMAQARQAQDNEKYLKRRLAEQRYADKNYETRKEGQRVYVAK